MTPTNDESIQFMQVINDKDKCENRSEEWYHDLRTVAVKMSSPTQASMRSKIGGIVWSNLISLALPDNWAKTLEDCEINGVNIVDWDMMPVSVDQPVSESVG